jgi:hypothetical protein
MGDVLDKIVEKITARLIVQIIFLKIVQFLRKYGKMWHSRAGHRWQCNAA